MSLNYQSPGVYSLETDLSTVVRAAATSIGAVVGASHKGPANTAQLVTNTKDFINIFGKPDPSNSYLHYSALFALEEMNQLYVTRVVNSDALYANMKVNKSSAGSASQVGGGISDPTAANLFSSDNNGLLLFYAANQGAWGNNLQIAITNIDNTNLTFTVEVYQTTNGVQVLLERIAGCSRKSGVDGYGQNQYVVDRVASNSNNIRVIDNTSVIDTTLPKAISNSAPASMGGGNDGSAVTSSLIAQAWSNIYNNPDQAPVNILINAGYVGNSDINVQTAMLGVAQNRQDCICILDIPSAKISSTDASTWRLNTQNFNSSYAALYSPWLIINDTFNDFKGIPIPPSGGIAQVIARRDFNQDPWQAPAGLNYGVIDCTTLPVTGLTANYTQGDRDTLYAANVNPLRTIPGQGNAVVWGQKTLQTKPSALDRINVRRLLITIEVALKSYLQYTLFELNDTFTRQQVVSTITQFMNYVKGRRGVYEFKVVCDTSNNTPQVIDNEQLNVDLYVQPTRAAEFIQLQSIITSTGVQLTEQTSNSVNV